MNDTENFPKAVALASKLCLASTENSFSVVRVDEDGPHGSTLAVVWREEGLFEVEAETISRTCGTVEEVLFFVAAVESGEWEKVSSGAFFPGPLPRY